jgi:pyrimidine deaminase RibD-like protein/GNAT superfamily N-acetyltransferase
LPDGYSQAQLRAVMAAWAARENAYAGDYMIVDTTQFLAPAAEPIPGSTLDLQRQRQAADTAANTRRWADYEASQAATPTPVPGVQDIEIEIPPAQTQWEVYDRNTDQPVFRMYAADQAEAWRKGQEWVANNDWEINASNYSVRQSAQPIYGIDYSVRPSTAPVSEGRENDRISFRIQKGKNKFATAMKVNDQQVGVYQYDANTGRSIAEVYPEFKGKGLGKLLVLHAIYTAAQLGLDFQEDESRTSAYDNVLDSLSSNGYIVDDDGRWYVTNKGEQYLTQSVKQDVAESREITKLHKLDSVLEKCIEMIRRGHESDPEKYGRVAACLIDNKNNHTYAINMPGPDGTRRHAERMAIDKHLQRHGRIGPNAIMITTLSPCVRHMDERYGESCTDLLSDYGIEKCYAGWQDPTQHPAEDYPFNLQVTDNSDIFNTCKDIAASFLPQTVAEGTEQITWIKPNFDYEWDEIEFQAKQPQVPEDVRSYMAKHFPNKDAWLTAVQNGKAVVVPPDHGQKIRNYPDNKKDLLNALSPASHDPQGPAKAKRVNALFDKGGPIEMPIILKTSKGLWLIGGKTRLGTANLLKGIPAKVWMIGGKKNVDEAYTGPPMKFLKPGELSGGYSPQQMQAMGFKQTANGTWYIPVNTWQRLVSGGQIKENFADGRHPEDKGDSKRHHVPTKSSVSNLRRFAKSHSGRAAQLAHWMANMKSGRAKKKKTNEAVDQMIVDGFTTRANSVRETIARNSDPKYQKAIRNIPIRIMNGNRSNTAFAQGGTLNIDAEEWYNAPSEVLTLVMAHEVGHILFGHDTRPASQVVSIAQDRQEEMDADKFALEIIQKLGIKKILVWTWLHRNSGESLEQIKQKQRANPNSRWPTHDDRDEQARKYGVEFGKANTDQIDQAIQDLQHLA